MAEQEPLHPYLACFGQSEADEEPAASCCSWRGHGCVAAAGASTTGAVAAGAVALAWSQMALSWLRRHRARFRIGTVAAGVFAA